ncbi:MAG: hypothetical protein AB1861_01070, partial [Cyanobacteriota bacterium]
SVNLSLFFVQEFCYSRKHLEFSQKKAALPVFPHNKSANKILNSILKLNGRYVQGTPKQHHI